MSLEHLQGLARKHRGNVVMQQPRSSAGLLPDPVRDPPKVGRGGGIWGSGAFYWIPHRGVTCEMEMTPQKGDAIPASSACSVWGL